MTAELWESPQIKKWFSVTEKWGDPLQMDYYLVLDLAYLCECFSKKLIVHCGYEKRSSGQHPHGKAVDFHLTGMSVFDQFIAASRFGFRGIGLYPYWNNPGLHVDNRSLKPGQKKALWGCTAPGMYCGLTKSFMQSCY